ncbi:MAG: hypothetical protein ACOYKE_14470, partial [Ferruginibacter sp.]
MKSIVLFGCLVLMLVTAQFATAQTIDEIIDKHIAARGGKDKLAGLVSVYMEGSREMMGNEVSVKVTKVQDKLSRTDFEMGSGNGFMLVTDKEAWNYFSMRGGAPNKMPEDAHAGMLTELDIAGPLVNYAAKGHKAELLGKETRDAIECYKIKLTTKAGKEVIYYVNAATSLIYQTSAKGGGMGGGRNRNPDAETITTYKDYQAFDGIQFALTVEMTVTGAETRGGGGTT